MKLHIMHFPIILLVPLSGLNILSNLFSNTSNYVRDKSHTHTTKLPD